MNKNKRQSILLDVITKLEIDTQEEIKKALSDNGIEATQATISRDIKELGLVKTAGSVKKYKYSRMSDLNNGSQKMMEMFRVAIISVEQAQNLIVIKTITGNANAVAASIDAQRIAEVLGTIAGDDTVLVIAKNNVEATIVVDKLNALL